MSTTRLVISLVLAGAAALSQAQSPKFVISTLAGAPLAAEPVPALSVAIGHPRGIAADNAGNVYFTTTTPAMAAQNLALLKLDQNGILTRVAGTHLSQVGDIAADNSGNVYLADSGIVKISSDGTVTRITGAPGSNINPSGLLAIDAAGDLYVSDNSNRIRRISPDGNITTVAGDGNYGYAGDGGPASSAQLGLLRGLAVDRAGNLYLSDNYYANYDSDDEMLVYARIRMVSPDGTIRTIAGSSPGYSGDGGPATGAQLEFAEALATDNAGNLYIADSSNNRIRKVSDGVITTVAGNGTDGFSGDHGPATSAQLRFPTGVAVDSAGNLYIADPPHIRKISPTGTISTVAGKDIGSAGVSIGDGGPAYTASLSGPTGVAVDGAGAVYIADTFAHRIRKVTSDGTITTIGGTGFLGPGGGDGLPALKVDLNWPSGLVIDPAGNLYIAEGGGGRIRKISPDGVIITVAGSIQASVPGFSGDGGPATGALLWWPKDIALDSSGNLYIADTGNNRIRMVTPAGIITTIAGTGASGYRYSGDGGPAIQAGLFFPSGLAVDGSGNLYVADTNNYRVRKISSDGIISTLAGNGVRGSSGDGGPALQAQLTSPTGLKLDSSGNLYIADSASVRMVSPAGIITTVAGTGAPGFSGDGGPATSAQLGAWGLAFDGSGNLYVADPSGNDVRLLKPTVP